MLQAHHQGSRLLRVITVLALVLGLAGALSLVTATATAAPVPGSAVSPTVDPSNGFPLWYQDGTGTRLAPCLDASDTNCVLLADPGFDPARPLSFPSNFPEEFFYSIVDSGRLDTRGCSGTKPGRISIRIALEGAFANGAVAAGDQMVFARVRLIATGGLCKTSTYTVTYPYGQLTFTTDSTGALARNQGTTDVGCTPVAPTACDWTIALSSPVLRSFLRWDPAVTPAAPAGYLGDAVTAHRITGATYTAPGETTPANYFRVTGPSLSSPLQTNLFTVSGKIAGPLSASPSAVDFGGESVGSTTDSRRITVTNLAAGAVTPQAATLTGAAAGDYRIVGDSCAGQALARDASCTVDVAFAPTVLGARAASLSIGHNGVRSPLTVPLNGTGSAPTDVAAAQVQPGPVDFHQQRVGVRSAARDLTVSSTGTKPLQVSAVSLGGADPGQYAVTLDTCTGQAVAPGATCTVAVAFDPTRVGPASARLRVDSNDPSGPAGSDLTGVGYGGVAAVSPTVDADAGFPDWYQDEKGVRVAQCIDPNDPNCIVLPGGTYAGQPPLHFPDNYPDEFFYSVVDSDTIATPGCAGSAPGRAMIRMAIEGAFANGDPAPGEQMTFGRIRINATSGLCPGQTYTFVHPYGVDQFTADADGSIKRSPGTDDVGCLAATADAPCDFGLAIRSRVFDGLLRWDPSSGAKAPAGYLGDGVTLHKVIGSNFTAPGESAPANYFRIYQGDQLIGQTDLFSVMGKLAGPIVTDPTAVDYGSVPLRDSATSPITVRNEGIDPVTVNTLSIAGAQAADFAVDGSTDGCTGRVLAAGSSCTVRVTFSPSAVGDRAARLVVNHTGLNGPTSVGLSGIGRAAEGIAALSVDRDRLEFGDLRVGRTSVAQTVTVSNRGGSAPLVVDSTTLSGPDAVDFTVTGSTCTSPVDPGATCEVKVAHTPTASGRATASLDVSAATADPRSLSVALSGTGFAGSQDVSATVRGSDGFPTWYQDANGLRLTPCLDPNDPRCVVLAGPGYDPAQPTSFPDNFPPEFFYALADSDQITTPGCDGTAPGTGMLRLAVEGTFAGDVAEPDQQITFGRVRLNVTSGLCPGATYTFTTPYGDVTATANASGGVVRTVGTTDVGCGAAPCNFGAALASPVFDGFLRWAPGVGDPAPAGYLGDGVSLHRVVGGTNVKDGEPVNYFAVTGPDGVEVTRTDRFIVSGKVATGLEGSAVGFADQQISTTSAAQTATFTNIATTPAAVASVDLVGADAGAFAIAGGTCAGSSVPGDGTCVAQVTFQPTATRAYDASLRLLAADGTVLGSVPVHGRGIDVGIARGSLTVTSLTFAATQLGATSAALNVGVTNTGTAPLTITGQTLSGVAAGDYTVTRGAGCASLAPGGSCVVAVRFAPTAPGTRTARLLLASNDIVGMPSVSLTGTGTAAGISLKSAQLDLGKVKAGRTATQTMQVTNSGTVPLTISAVTVDDTVNYSVNRGTCTTAVAAGRSCQISVTFTAQGAPRTVASTVRFVSNAYQPPTLRVTAAVS